MSFNRMSFVQSEPSQQPAVGYSQQPGGYPGAVPQQQQQWAQLPSASSSTAPAVGRAQASVAQITSASSSHSYSLTETRAYCDFINQLVGSQLNPSSDELFQAVAGGGLLLDVLDKLSDESKRLIANIPVSRPPKNKFAALCNHKAALDVSLMLGCSITNIGPGDLAEGTPYLVLGVVWQLIRYGLLKSVSLDAHPELAVLRRDGEDSKTFVDNSAESNLLRWVNYHLAKSSYGKTVANFGPDFKDGQAYLYLLNQLDANQCPLDAIASSPDALTRATAAVENGKRYLGQSALFVEPADIVGGNDRLNLAFVATLFNFRPQLCEQPMAPTVDLESAIQQRHAAEAAERARLADELAAQRRQWEEEENAKRQFLEGEAMRLAKERTEFERQRQQWEEQQRQQSDAWQRQQEAWQRQQQEVWQRQQQEAWQRQQWEEWQRQEQARLAQEKARLAQDHERVYQTIQQWVAAEYGASDASERMVLQEWFKSVDQDNSGLIDAEELSLALQSSGEAFDQTMVTRLFQTFDESGMQKISFDSFCVLFKFISAMRQAFQLVDVNGTGLLDRPAIEFALVNAHMQFADTATVGFLFNIYDRARRGRLSFENFLEMCTTIAISRKIFQQRLASAAPGAAPPGCLRLTLVALTDLLIEISPFDPNPPKEALGARPAVAAASTRVSSSTRHGWRR